MSAAALLLWDIDGTLIAATGHDERRYGVVLRELLGDPSIPSPEHTSGLTDHGILRQALVAWGLSDEEAGLLVPAALEAHERLTAAEADAIPLLPGARELLEHEWPVPVLQTVGTGNARRRARIKLEAAGLLEHFDLAVGGYGDLPAERSTILAEAVTRAGLLRGGAVAPERVVVVGDTPRDVAAAQRAGLRSVGVATGHHDAAALAEAGADLVVEDLASGAENLRAFVVETLGG